MSKAKNNKTSKKQKTRDVIYTIIVLAIVVLVIVFFFAFSYNPPGKNSLTTSDGSLSLYNPDTCRCLEKDRAVCELEGFEYNMTRKLCVNVAKKSVTFATLTCSKYECSGIVYDFNKITSEWEPKTN